MVVFLWRPSPQVPRPSVDGARRCFEASRTNIEIQRAQIEKSSVDLTWVFTQSLFMAINTILWSVSIPEIREEHPKTEIQDLILGKAVEAALYASLRWPGVEGAIELYGTLTHACLRAYGEAEESVRGDDPSDKTGSLSSPGSTPSPFSSPSTTKTGPARPISPYDAAPEPSPTSQGFTADAHAHPKQHSAGQLDLPVFDPNWATSPVSPGFPAYVHALDDVGPKDSIQVPDNSFPLQETSDFGMFSSAHLFAPLFENRYHMSHIIDPYARFSFSNGLQPTPVPQIALNMEQQTELMDRLEADRLQGVIF
jgi:hypothetical protein